MTVMRRIILLCLLAQGLALPVFSKPVIGPPVNQASFFPPALPQYGIARGAMFAIFGQSMGPAELVIVSAFPLATNLAETSVRVATGGETRDCLIIFTSAGQLAAVLPSDTPLGEGTVTVTYQGETSEPAPILVVKGTVGIFTIRQDGQGPGVYTDANFAVNTITNAFPPGAVAIAWVTGLGARRRDDMPMPEDLKDQINIRVVVGGQEAKILYAGPSGCCGGVDQVVFEIPEGLEGCFVPAVIWIGEAISNFASISISSQGTTCSDNHGLLASEIDRLAAEGSFMLLSGLLSRGVFETVQGGSSTAPLLESTNVAQNGPIEASQVGVSVRNFDFDKFFMQAEPLAEGGCSAYWYQGSQRPTTFQPDLVPASGSLNYSVSDSGGQRTAGTLTSLTDPPFLRRVDPSYFFSRGATHELKFGGRDPFRDAELEIEGLTEAAKEAINSSTWGADLEAAPISADDGSSWVDDTWFQNSAWSRGLGSRYSDPAGGQRDWRRLADRFAFGGELDPVFLQQDFIFQMSGELTKEGFTTGYNCFYPLTPGATGFQLPAEVLASMQQGPGTGFQAIRLFPSNITSTAFEELKAKAFDDQVRHITYLLNPFRLASFRFSREGTLPEDFTCEGEDQSPPLFWFDPPEGVLGYAVIMDDLDANGFAHWVLFDIDPADVPTKSLPQDFQPGDFGVSGANDFFARGYRGPCPPEGDLPHRYRFRVFALDTPSLGLAPGARAPEVINAMQGHILGEAELTGRFGR